jgi:hypothetical protein
MLGKDMELHSLIAIVEFAPVEMAFLVLIQLETP